MKVEISDGRTLIGQFLCTDADENIILGSCQEFIGNPSRILLYVFLFFKLDALNTQLNL